MGYTGVNDGKCASDMLVVSNKKLIKCTIRVNKVIVLEVHGILGELCMS